MLIAVDPDCNTNALALAISLVCAAGCERQEKILDVDTPGGQVEITRDRDTGDVDLNATDKKTIVDVDTPGADVEVKRDADTGGVDVDVNKN